MNRLKTPIAILLLTLFLAGEPVLSPASRDSALPVPVEVVGRGFVPVFFCGLCVAGALTLIAGGWGAILVAAIRPGSTGVVIGCVATCVSAFK